MKWLLTILFVVWASLASAQTNCLVPSTFPATPIVSTVLEGSHVLKAAPGCLLSVYVVTGNVGGFLLVLNATTVPVDGAITPIECVPVGANSFQFINFAPQPPEFYSVGIVAAFSTTGCLTKTASATAWFHAIVQ